MILTTSWMLNMLGRPAAWVFCTIFNVRKRLALPLLALCVTASLVDSIHAFTFHGTNSISLTTQGGSFTQAFAGGTFDYPDLPTVLYYAFNYEYVPDVTFHGGISTDGTPGVCGGSPFSGCAFGGSGRLDSFGFSYVSISGSLYSNRAATATIVTSFGGTDDLPEKYDNLIASGLENNTRSKDSKEGDEKKCETEECDARASGDQVSGAMLVSDKLGVPVFAEHGLTDYVWANAAIAESPTAEPWRAGYFFDSEIPFTHFTIPEALPGGDDEFEIRVNRDEIYTLEAGVPFDFTNFYPEGVFGFVLTGFDYDEGIAAHYSFPYTHGYRFAEEGGTIIHHGRILPGDFSMGGLVDDYDLALWQASFGVDDGGDADGDGDTDGRDFLIWQRNYYPGEDPPAVGPATVPEPSAFILLVVSCAFAVGFRRLSHTPLIRSTN